MKMSEAGTEPLNIKAWILYTSEDFSTGEVKDVCTIMTEKGKIYSTISNTFIREFKDIVSIFGLDIDEIRVISRESKAGRRYITCTV